MPDPSAPVQARLRDLVGAAAGRLDAAGVPSPRFDAEELAAFALGVRRGRLRSVERLDDDALARFESAVRRRERRVPLQHIVGTTAFRHVEVAVGPGVFVPRPETEVVAGWAVDRAREVAGSGRAPLVVDLCTGSGAIALSVADEVPGSRVHAVELDPGALVWAARNLDGTAVTLHAGDAATALPDLEGTVDVVVSNPPYIPDDGVVRDPEVLEHDPPAALWGHGPDGLDVLRAVAVRAAALLRPGGWFVVEHADVQGAAVPAALLRQGGWEQVVDHRDLAGRDRFTTARRVADGTAQGAGPGTEDR
jgi:release factor glutamine methyltransferase